jgi:GR25 family glycosyltransferase involved in LPS biosynthesis
MVKVYSRQMSSSFTPGGTSFLALLLLWGGLALMATAKPTTDEQQCRAPVTTASSVAAGRAGVIKFLQGRLPPTGGKFELRFEEDDAQDADQNQEDDEDEPETATYVMASSRNRMDYARIARCRERHEEKKKEGEDIVMDMTLPFPVFYINMDKSSDRRKRMERNFGKLWNLRRFPGVDGRNETLVKSLVAPEDYEAILPYLVEQRTMVTMKKNGTNKEEEEEAKDGGKRINQVLTSELGASLAHLTAIRQAYLEGHKVVMIAEDDLSPLLTPCWTSSIRDLVKDAEGTDWDLIQLGWLVVKNASIYHAVEWGPNKRLIKQQNQYGAASYLISRRGMEAIMDLFFTDKTSTGLAKVFTEPDTWGNIVVETYLGKLTNLYVAMPSLFIVETFDTTIGSEEGTDFRLLGWRFSNNHHITATLKLFDEIVGVPEEEEEEDYEVDEDEEEEEGPDEKGSRKDEL